MEHLLHESTPLVSEYGLIIIFLGMIVEGTAMILLTGLLCYMGIFSFTELMRLKNILGRKKRRQRESIYLRRCRL